MLVRRLTAGIATLCAVAVAVSIAPLAAAAKKPETTKTPPGQVAKELRADAPSAVGAVQKPKPAKPAKPPQAATPDHARGPRKKAAPAAPVAPSQPAPSTAAATPPPSTATPSTPPETSPAPAASPPRRAAPGERRSGVGSRQERPSSGAGAPARSALTPSASPTDARRGSAAAAPRDRRSTAPQEGDRAEPASPVVRTVRDIVATVPGWVKLAIAALGGLSLLLAGGYAASVLRARRLARQRDELLGDVGLLQRALLPTIPARLGGLAVSVAYRPADGPGAGGDFYDALPLSGGRTGFVLGDISGHGRTALERTALMRYTLRAYLEAGLEPAAALQVAGRAIGDGLDGDFATVLLAIHDPRDGSLTYASAGHPPPIVTGGTPFEPVIAGSAPPIAVGQRTGLRQTTVPLVPGGVACLFTDGLTEARTTGGLLGTERLEEIVGELGSEPSAADLLDRVAAEAVATPDDMAACLLTPTARVTSGGFRNERLELSAAELEGPLLDRFLAECGVPAADRAAAVEEARATAARFDGATVGVAFGGRRVVTVLPRNVESIERAARRAV